MQPLITLQNIAPTPLYKRFHSNLGEHFLVVPYSRIFDLGADLSKSLEAQDPNTLNLISALAHPSGAEISLDQVVAPSPQSISLNISSSCNLSCAYCYAAQGSFSGAQPKPMSWEVARAAVDQLLTHADSTVPITVGFLGGEPFVNRHLLHKVVHYADSQAKTRQLDVRFAVTTNGTLLNPDDIFLLRRHSFAVTVSVDGGEILHNQQRPLSHHPQGSFEKLSTSIMPLLNDPGKAQIAARATVTRDDFNLTQRFNEIVAIGFPEVGFAPLRSAKPNGGALQDQDWHSYLMALIQLATAELTQIMLGGNIRLTNLAIALKQLHRGASSPYPCGAGGGYFSVGANGDWYACHRAIGSSDYRLGNNTEINPLHRQQFLEQRHVHAQPACQSCWARYLCSGGCHQEAANRTESSCEFIRGWLEFCLKAYCELIENKPDYFQSPTF